MDNDLNLPSDSEDIEIIYFDGEDDVEAIEQIFEEVDIDDEEPVEAEVIDLSSLTFSKHNKSVFSSDVSKDDRIAITGGEDDMAYLWSTQDGQILFECTGHKDSVTEVCFNHDNSYVATGDLSGMIQVWSTKEHKLVWCFEGDDVESLFWHSMANVLFCCSHSGDIYMWQIPQGNCKVFTSPSGFPTSCAKLLHSGKELLAGYENGQLKLWNLKETSVVWSNTEMKSITNIDINKESTLAVIAPEGKIVKLSDGKIISEILPDGETEIEIGLFHSELGVVVTGSLSGQLCVWETGKYVLRHQARIEAAVTLLKWGPNGKIFIGATDGAIYVCNVKTCSLIETLTGHKQDILSISVFKDGLRVLSTSDDGTAKIFNVKSI